MEEGKGTLGSNASGNPILKDLCFMPAIAVSLLLQNLVEEGKGTLGTDASGNPILKDIGTHIKTEIKKHPYFQVAVYIPRTVQCTACSDGLIL
jgi:hypothetical protein